MEAVNPLSNASGIAMGSFVNPRDSGRAKGLFCNFKVTSFTVKSSDWTQYTIYCWCKQNEAVTHADSKTKTSISFIWQAADDYQGDVLFRCTFVKDYSTFWVAVPSSNGLVRVGTVTDAPPINDPLTIPIHLMIDDLFLSFVKFLDSLL